MRVVSFNVNGIRSSIQKGLIQWLDDNQVDIFCVQELKAQYLDLEHSNLLYLGERKGYFSFADQKGYSGVGIYSRAQPLFVYDSINDSFFDGEGRFIALRFESFCVACVYFPSGTSGQLRQDRKIRFLAVFEAWLDSYFNLLGYLPLIICGDFNIAHQTIDLFHWKQNQKKTGFLPEERQWFSHLLSHYELKDIYRELHPNEETYSWWSLRTKARERNIGWRIDYQLITGKHDQYVQKAYIDQTHIFSDHAPVIVDYCF